MTATRPRSLLRFLGGVPSGLARPAAGARPRAAAPRAGGPARRAGGSRADRGAARAGRVHLATSCARGCRGRRRRDGRAGRGRAARARCTRCGPTSATGPPLDQSLYLDAHLFLPDRLLICGDKMSMAHSPRAARPLPRPELMDWVERVPGRLRTGLRAKKRLHREAIAPLVPARGPARARARASPRRSTSGCARSLAAEVRRRWSEEPRSTASPAAPWSSAWSTPTSPAAPTTSACSTRCSSWPSGTARSSRGAAREPRQRRAV